MGKIENPACAISLFFPFSSLFPISHSLGLGLGFLVSGFGSGVLPYPFDDLVSRRNYRHALFFLGLFFIALGFFPEALASGLVRGGGPEASILVVLGRFFPLFFGAVCTVPGKTRAFRSIRIFGLSLIRTCGAKSAFPLFLRFRWSTQPALSLPVPLFFPPFSPFLSIKGTYPVGFRPA